METNLGLHSNAPILDRQTERRNRRMEDIASLQTIIVTGIRMSHGAHEPLSPRQEYLREQALKRLLLAQTNGRRKHYKIHW